MAASAKGRRRGRPPDSTSAETREAILDAARRGFAQSGFEATTNKQIAEAAGITAASLYHYVPSKQALYAAVLDATRAQVLDAFREAAAEPVALVDRLRAVLGAAAALHERDPAIARFVSVAQVDVARHPELHEVGVRHGVETYEFFAELVRQGDERGELASGADPTVVTRMLLATTMGLAQSAAWGGDDGAVHVAVIHAFEDLVSGELFTRRGRRRR